MLALADLGIADPGQRQGDHRQDQSDRRHGQQQMSGRVGEVEGQRADAAGRPGDHHVDGEDAAAILVARLVVEPALDDDILPGDGIARDHAQDHPDGDLVEDQEQQRRRRGDGGEDGEAADMPDPVDDPVAGEGAQQEAAEIGRADEADQLRGLLAMGELKGDRRRQICRAPSPGRRRRSEPPGWAGRPCSMDESPSSLSPGVGLPSSPRKRGSRASGKVLRMMALDSRFRGMTRGRETARSTAAAFSPAAPWQCAAKRGYSISIAWPRL